MNRIVRENYPVSQLPDDIQQEFPGQKEVTLTVETRRVPEADRSGSEPPYGRGAFSRFRHLAKARYASTEEIASHVRAQRDEWDARDHELTTTRGS